MVGITLLSSNVSATNIDQIIAEIDNLKQIQSMKGQKKIGNFQNSNNTINKSMDMSEFLKA